MTDIRAQDVVEGDGDERVVTTDSPKWETVWRWVPSQRQNSVTPPIAPEGG